VREDEQPQQHIEQQQQIGAEVDRAPRRLGVGRLLVADVARLGERPRPEGEAQRRLSGERRGEERWEVRRRRGGGREGGGVRGEER